MIESYRSGNRSTTIIVVLFSLLVIAAVAYLVSNNWTTKDDNDVGGSGGIYKGEEYVGQFRREGKVPVPKAALDEWVVSTYTEDEPKCEELKATLNRICSPIQQQSVDTSVSTISHFCSFKIKCPKNVVDGGELFQYIKPDEIEQDEMMFIEAVNSWGLDRIDQEKLPLSQSYNYSYDGTGSVVYIIDTGINSKHTEYAGRYKGGRDFMGDHARDDPEDGNGHGTHCAGTALGTKYGVAKGAILHGARVLNDSGSGRLSGIVDGVSWAVNHWKTNYKGKGMGGVLSLSLGGNKNSTTNKAVTAAAEEGVIVVVAAGNSRADACNYSPASAGGKARTNLGSVVTVMASDIDDRRSSFSNWGSCTDIIAPGTSITSSWIGGTDAKKTISGTSMATPHVAGLAAQLLQKHKGNNKAALKEMFTIGPTGLITDPKFGTKNQLIRVPGTETVDGLIPQPPVPKQLQLDFGGYKLFTVSTDKKKTIFMSLFGGYLPDPSDKGYPVIFLGDWTNGENVKGCGDLGMYGPDVVGTYRPLTGAVVFVERGPDGCTFGEKALKAQERGAAMVIFYMDSFDVPFNANGGEFGPSVKIVSGMIMRETASLIKKASSQSGGMMFVKEQ